MGLTVLGRSYFSSERNSKNTKSQNEDSISHTLPDANHLINPVAVSTPKKEAKIKNITTDILGQLPLIHALRTAENNPYAITCPGKEHKSDTCRTIRFEVRPGDYAFNGSRSQIRLKNRHTQHIQFDLRLEKYEYQNDWFSIMDWHVTAAFHKAYPNTEEKKYFSPIAIQLVGTDIKIYNRANGHINKKEKNSVKFVLKEGWNHIDIRIKIADDQTGRLAIKVNDLEKVFDDVATTYDVNFPTFLKFGIYRSATYSDTSVVEFRNVIVDDSLVVPNFSRRAAGENVVDQLNGLKQDK